MSSAKSMRTAKVPCRVSAAEVFLCVLPSSQPLSPKMLAYPRPAAGATPFLHCLPRMIITFLETCARAPADFSFISELEQIIMVHHLTHAARRTTTLARPSLTGVPVREAREHLSKCGMHAPSVPFVRTLIEFN